MLAAGKRPIPIAAWFTPASVAVAGLTLTLFGFLAAQHANQQQLEAGFEERAARRLVQLQDAINVHVTLLRSIAGLYAASDFVSRKEFETFVSNQPLAKFGDALLYWVPRVSPARRDMIEAAARADGIADFHIWSDESDAPADGTDREYFPVLYAEPRSGGQNVLGYDLNTDSASRLILERARDSGEPAVSGRVTMTADPNEEPAIVIAFPIYASKAVPRNVESRRVDLAGFAVGAFQLRKLINASLLSDSKFGQDIYIYDESAVAPEPRLLYFSPSRTRAEAVEPLSEDEVLADYHRSGVVDVPARKWTIVFRAGPNYFAPWSSWIGWMIFSVGTVLTFLVVAYEWRRAVHTRRIEALVADLSASHAQLEDEIAERKEAEAKLRQSQKVEAVGQLTGGIAHDFNNLLTIIIGNMEIAREKTRGNNTLAENIGSALTAAVRGAALTHRLLAFARRQVLEPEILDFNEVIGVMHDLLRRALGESIQIETALSKRLWPALADRNQVEGALLNLAINARDAMPEGGRLTIETQSVLLDADYARRNDDVAPGEYVMLAVSDTGAGMSPEILKQAIEPFFTTKEPGKGTGLGLSSIYGFAKQSGGHLKLYSEEGRGTTVRLYLPRARGVEGQVGRFSDAVPRGGRESILVVEDEPHVREVAVTHLIENGYRVLEADQGQEALELIESHLGEIDMLLTDVILAGGMNGRGLAAEAQKRIPSLKVLYMSGYAEQSVEGRGRPGPGVVLLQKPFLKTELLRAVRGVFDAG